MLDVKVLGVNIKNRRLQLGMSQAQLAGGIATQGTISNVENGTHTPSIELLMDIARRLKTTLDQLILPTEEGQNYTAFGIQTLIDIELLWNERKYSDVLSAVQGAEDAPFFSNTYNRAELNLWRAKAYYSIRKIEQSQRICEEQIGVLRGMGETLIMVEYYNVSASCHMLAGNLETARDLLEKAWWILNKKKFPKSEELLIRVLSNLTNVHLRLGDHAKASYLGKVAVRHACLFIGKSQAGVIYELLAEAFYSLGDQNNVQAHLDLALGVHELAQDTVAQARVLNNLAVLSQSQGNTRNAQKYLARSSQLISAKPDLPHSRSIEADMRETVARLLGSYDGTVPETSH